MSKDNVSSILSGPPTQRKFWQVVRTDNGGLFNLNGQTKIYNHREAQQLAQEMTVAHRVGITIMESIDAITPKHDIEVVKIVDE